MSRLRYVLPITRELLRPHPRLDRGGEGSFVIVTGSGRSGTSAVARVLHESGLAMGTAFDPPSEVNRTGFYEDLHVRALNQEIVAELGWSDLQRPARWPWRATVRAVARRHGPRMATLAGESVAGWKDPLFCMLLEAWLPHLPRAPKVVVCLRSPEAYLQSLSHIVGLVRREAVERWWANDLRRLLDIVRAYGLEATCVEYDELVQHPDGVVEDLATFVGRPLDASYVAGELRHHVHQVPRRYQRLYDEVRALGRRRARPAVAPATDAAEAYLERAREIEARAGEAKQAWAKATGMPEPRIEDIRAARTATEPYAVLLSEAQREIAALAPPPALETYHDLLRVAVDHERLAAQLMLRACAGETLDRTLLDGSVTVWRRYCAPDAVARGERQRARALEQARRAPAAR